MTNPTPAVQRAGEALREAAYDGTADGGDFYITDARTALTAALTDPDDPDALARTLFVARRCGVEPSYGIDPALRLWETAGDRVRSNWRGVADLFRTMLTGSGS